MRGMNSESVDLIYLDPPFNSKVDYSAPIGSEAAGAEFKDTWTLNDIDIAWLDLIVAKHPSLWRVIQAAMTNSDKSYLIYMSVRLLEMKRLLKPTGSIYLHCDPTMSHYLKLVMDSIFGRKNFRNEIIWERGTASGGKAGGKKFVPQHDTILSYVAGEEFKFHRQYTPYTKEYIAQRFKYIDESGRRYRLQLKNRRQYLDQSKGKPVPDIWTDIPPVNPMAKEKTNYPTQKPVALLKRIIKASCPEDGIVLDPFCGCATTCVASEIEGREWAGIDIGPKAYDLVKTRLDREIGLSTYKTCINRKDMPQRTDVVPLKKYNHPDNKKFLYGEQGGHCNGCRVHFMIRNFTVDHIIPKSKGGTDHLENLQLLCGNCNSVKGDRGQEYLVARLTA